MPCLHHMLQLRKHFCEPWGLSMTQHMVVLLSLAQVSHALMENSDHMPECSQVSTLEHEVLNCCDNNCD